MLDFADKVAKLCLHKYNSLKKSGKPTNNEWTVLSSIVLKSNVDELSVVALCTGTKCLSGKELTSTKFEERGSRLSDSHAEILTRRAFLRYLYSQVASVLKCRHSDIFILNDKGNITIKKGISFHFFSSQTPCGDCSIIPKINTSLLDGNNHPSKKIKLVNKEEGLGIEVWNEVDDIHRTGAKCISTDERQDLRQPGKNYHVLGPLRTKPGRGDRTLSLSCSDKIAKWIVVGIQGSLLSLFTPVIKLETIIIGGECPFSIESMERGLFKRFDSDFVGPNIIQSSISFQQKKGNSRQNPCPSSIIWSLVPERDMEVAAEGRKQGSTKKKPGRCLLVSRRAFLKTFLEIYDRYSNSPLPLHPKKITYFHCKQWSKSYQKLWHEAKVTVFRSWPSKPLELQNFTL